jgi:hypothetical protein
MFDLHLPTTEERHRRKEEAKRNKRTARKEKNPTQDLQFTKERAANI